jgi:catechol 2,3-dioxygenase-like lactoylglutathione lyase family enzyme
MSASGSSPIRYAHTNLIAIDWRRLQEFYVQVFDCVPVSTERDTKGPAFEALTGDVGGGVKGRHLRLPGHGEGGPTLEIFQYQQNDPAQSSSLKRPGFAHLAFEVPDVEAKRREVHAWGGRDVGQLVTLDLGGAGRLTLVYVTDPEGNIVELQRWL